MTIYKYKNNYNTIVKVLDEYDNFINVTLDSVLNYKNRINNNIKILLLIDNIIYKKYQTKIGKLQELLSTNNIKCFIYQLSSIENNKNFNSVQKVLDKLFEYNFCSNSLIINIGGGIISDIGGFVAGIFKRGINIINIPTTLIAMCDASVGGKNGVNNKYGKNNLGTILHPIYIIIYINFIKTLDYKNFKFGFSEVIKYGIIYSKSLLNYIDKYYSSILNKEYKFLIYTIKKCIEIKIHIIKKSILNSNYRNILNFGHTIGHALELNSNFNMIHGEAIAIGIVVELYIAQIYMNINIFDIKYICNIFNNYKIPFKISKEIDISQIYLNTLKDKKSSNNNSYYSLPNKIGEISDKYYSYKCIVSKQNILKSINKNKIHP